MTENSITPNPPPLPTAAEPITTYFPLSSSLCRLDSLLVAATEQLCCAADDIQVGMRRAHDLISIAQEQLQQLRDASHRDEALHLIGRVRS